MKPAVPPTPTFCSYGITLVASNHSHYPEPLQPIGKVPILAFNANGKFIACRKRSTGKTV